MDEINEVIKGSSVIRVGVGQQLTRSAHLGSPIVARP